MKGIYLVILFILVASCVQKRRFNLYVSNGKGFETVSVHTQCDSVKMLTRNRAVIYVDGISAEIYADQIIISTNPYFKK